MEDARGRRRDIWLRRGPWCCEELRLPAGTQSAGQLHGWDSSACAGDEQYKRWGLALYFSLMWFNCAARVVDCWFSCGQVSVARSQSDGDICQISASVIGAGKTVIEHKVGRKGNVSSNARNVDERTKEAGIVAIIVRNIYMEKVESAGMIQSGDEWVNKNTGTLGDRKDCGLKHGRNVSHGRGRLLRLGRGCKKHSLFLRLGNRDEAHIRVTGTPCTRSQSLGSWTQPVCSQEKNHEFESAADPEVRTVRAVVQRVYSLRQLSAVPVSQTQQLGSQQHSKQAGSRSQPPSHISCTWTGKEESTRARRKRGECKGGGKEGRRENDLGRRAALISNPLADPGRVFGVHSVRGSTAMGLINPDNKKSGTTGFSSSNVSIRTDKDQIKGADLNIPRP
ncbi:hypothetical protein FB451DRAFT_1477664 [Mycena latifolia]|nr:hypothetical protein FB451DRAFT_1477664 [Mycena latifolia]